MKRTLSINIAFVLVVLIAPFKVAAQKLPNKQEVSSSAPLNVKIDGMANEWNFKAYNNATDVFYTIAHNADNIYLIIKAADESTVRKILSGGITFSISTPGKKTDTDAAKITYPVFNYKNKPDIKFSLKSVPADSVDFVVSSNNKKFLSEGKFLRVSGIKGLDSLLSVYNDSDIALASSFDKEMNYTYELALPRKLVQPLINVEGKFYYKVLLNPIQLDDMPGIVIRRDANDNIISVNIEKSLSSKLSESAQLPTDFSGEYTLTQ